MAFDAHANLVKTTIAIAPSPAASGTGFTVADGSDFPAAPFNCTVGPANAQADRSNAEIVRVTSKGSGTDWTALRDQEDLSPRSILVGDVISLNVTAKTLTDLESFFSSGHGAPGAAPAAGIGVYFDEDTGDKYWYYAGAWH